MADKTARGAGSEEIAVSALAWISGDEAMLQRFLAITGIEAGQIRAAAREPGFLAGVLDFVLAHEPSLMAFAEASGHAPGDVSKARFALAGHDYGPGDFV